MSNTQPTFNNTSRQSTIVTQQLSARLPQEGGQLLTSDIQWYYYLLYCIGPGVQRRHMLPLE
jgi:hypothetical protein